MFIETRFTELEFKHRNDEDFKREMDVVLETVKNLEEVNDFLSNINKKYRLSNFDKIYFYTRFNFLMVVHKETNKTILKVYEEEKDKYLEIKFD